jgi:hypothetical protein
MFPEILPPGIRPPIRIRPRKASGPGQARDRLGLARPGPDQWGVQYLFAIGSSSAGNSEITSQPVSVTTTSSSIRAAE